MKVWKIVLVIFVSAMLLTTLFGCSKKAATTATTQYTVKRGDISNTITAAGNLALAQTQDVPINLFYPNGTKGTVATVNVELGDSVKSGEVLVTIDPDEWADQLTTVQNNLGTAQRNVTTKATALTDAQRSLNNLKNAVATAQVNITKAQRAVPSAQLGVTSAQLNITSANDTLNNITEVQKAKNDIDDAQTMIRVCNMNLASGSGDSLYWQTQRNNAQTQLLAAQAYYNDLVHGLNITVTADIALQIAQAELNLNQKILAVTTAQQALDDANTAVTTAQQAVDDANYSVTKQQLTVANAQSDLDTANTALATAQKKLTDAQAMSPNVVAPFDGFVTSVGVKGGDQVLNGVVAVTVADSTKFQANILVSEMNIMSVHVGGQATMSLNALSGITLPATVTQIAPTASISSGVVNYAVTVNITSVTPVSGRSSTGSLPSSSANGTAQFSAALEQAVASGRITQAQADALAQQAASGGLGSGLLLQQAVASGRITQAQADALAQAAAASTIPTTRTGAAGTPSGSPSGRPTSSLPSSTAQNFQLKQGLSGTVSVILSQANNVLLVPNNSITKSGGQSTVNLVTGNNTIEKRTIQTGLSDFQNTQVTSGLSEGDKIQITKVSSTAPTTTAAKPGGGGGIFIGR
jgi:multidrug efflux pump subunit AcrA (membrane-fusion protein)